MGGVDAVGDGARRGDERDGRREGSARRVRLARTLRGGSGEVCDGVRVGERARDGEKSAEAGGHAERGRTERRRRSGARRRRRSVIARERSAEVTERSGCVFSRHARVHRRSQDGFSHRKSRTIVGASRSRFNSHAVAR